MKKIFVFIAVVFPLVFIINGCIDNPIDKEKAKLLTSDFPSVVLKIEASETCECTGMFRITTKRMDGNTFNFSSNVKYAIGDTITLGIDTTHSFAKVLAMGAKVEVPDSVKTPVPEY